MSFPRLLLPIFLMSQAIFANPSYRELMELADLLAVEKRLLSDAVNDDFITVCTQEPIELGLVIDASSSIHPRDFQRGQQFLHDFLSEYDIGSGRNQVRVAAVTFGYGVYEDDAFYLNSFKTKQEVLDAVQNMPFKAGLRTDTGDAIKFMREKQMAKTRSWAPKIAIVLTDGNSQRTAYTKEQAALARAENITMFAFGVGSAVRQDELLNIAGDPSRVLRASSYSELDEEKRKELAKQACIQKPRPTTTTTTTTTTMPPPNEQPCSDEYPSDINFIFSPAALGVDATSWVTQFISRTIANKELERGFQYGVVSGACPDDAGFALNRYSDVADIRARLDDYDRNNLPSLIRSAAATGFTERNGGRSSASKVAVIFLGKAKVDSRYLYGAIQELLSSGVQVFVSRTDPGIDVSLPSSVRLLEEGSSISQAAELVSQICHLDKDLRV